MIIETDFYILIRYLTILIIILCSKNNKNMKLVHKSECKIAFANKKSLFNAKKSLNNKKYMQVKLISSPKSQPEIERKSIHVKLHNKKMEQNVFCHR